MSLHTERKKIILFGLLGAAGCLVGALAGEGLYLAWLTPSGAAAATSLVERPQVPLELAPLPPPPDPPPAPPPNQPPPSPRVEFSREFRERLDRERAEDGALEIALAWQDYNDVDLHCSEPGGTVIWAIARESESGGKLDIDMNGTSGGPFGFRRSDTPVEHIRWARGRVPYGRYRVLVHGFDNHGGPNLTRFNVALRWSDEIAVTLADGKQLPVSASVPFPSEAKVDQLAHLAATDPMAYHAALENVFVFEFDVRRATPSLRMSVPEEVRLHQGGRNIFSVLIARTSFRDPVTLRLAGDVEDIEALECTISGDAEGGEIRLEAQDAARGGERRVKVIATGMDVQAEADMKLTVIPLPATLRLSTPAELPVNQGTANKMTIRIARDHFRGPVDLRFAGDLTGLSFKDATIAADQSETEVEVRADAGLPLGKRQIRVTASGGDTSGEAALRVVVRPQSIRSRPVWSWHALLVTSAWTALLAIGLSLALVMGQNHHLGRALLSSRELVVVVVGGTLAGLLAGSVGQVMFYGLMRLALLPQPGLVVGWLLLGGLLARGVGAYVPNLPPYRSMAAGLVGGVLAAVAFLVISDYDDRAGRLVGAALLGVCIGLMVAVVEAAFRVAWLEVVYGGRETRRVTLGREPVSLGGSSAYTIFVAGAPAGGLQYTFGGGKIYCRTGAGPSVVIAPGDQRTLGSVRVIARAHGAPAAPAGTVVSKLARTLRLRFGPAPAGTDGGNRVWALRLRSGQVVPLPTKARLCTADLPGLRPARGSEYVAEVVPHPRDQTLLGLKNLSARVWSVRMPDGRTREIEQGRSLQLVPGARIDFGTVQGELI